MLTVRVYDNYNLIALQGLDKMTLLQVSRSLEPKLVEIWKLMTCV
eukprot:UN00973